MNLGHFGCKIFFPQFWKSDMSRYGYISMYFRESLGVRDNESRLYVYYTHVLLELHAAFYNHVVECLPLDQGFRYDPLA